MLDIAGKPQIFIGSSSEQKAIAEQLKEKLASYANVNVWSETFPLSEGTMESLVNAIGKSDFAIFILTDDDVVEIRKQKFRITRDNVIFESGMAIGTLGRKRTFLLAPANLKEFHLPSDLLGFTVAQYDKDEYAKEPTRALDLPREQVVQAIRSSRWATLNLSVKAKILIDNKAPDHHWKLWIEFKNNESFAVTCISKQFLPKTFRITGGYETYQPAFFYYEASGTKEHIRKPAITLQSKELTNCYVPLDVEEGLRISKRNKLKIDCGTFQFDCIVNENLDILRYRAVIHTEGYQNNSIIPFNEANMHGLWVNSYGANGQEDVFIDRHMNYFINNESKPSFIIRSFGMEDGNKIKFTKKGAGGRPDYENILTPIDDNTLIGMEHQNSGEAHEIRYVRKL